MVLIVVVCGRPNLCVDVCCKLLLVLRDGVGWVRYRGHQARFPRTVVLPAREKSRAFRWRDVRTPAAQQESERKRFLAPLNQSYAFT